MRDDLPGRQRVLVGSRARIGLHQSARYVRGMRVCDPTTYSSASREMAAYLKDVIPAKADEIGDVMLHTPCDSIEWVYGQRAVDLGVATKIEWEGVEVGPGRRKPAG